jgi:hypothetical protein
MKINQKSEKSNNYFVNFRRTVVVVIAWLLDLQLPVQSVTFTFYLVIKFVCDFRQVGGFLRVLQFLPPNKSDRHVFTEIFYKDALNYSTQNTNVGNTV